MNMDLVYIEWIDSRGVSASWDHLESLDSELCTIKSVGWVLKQTEDLIHIVPHLGHDPDQGCGDMVIPTNCIIKKRNLK